MHSWICHHRSMRLLGDLNVCIVLYCAACIGVDLRFRLSSHKLYICLMARMTSSHKWFFYRVCSPKPWPFGKILRSPLRSWWFHLSCFIPKKWRMLQGCRKIWLRFPRKPALRFYPKLLALSSLVARSFRSFNHADLATASLYYLCKGDLMFLEGLIFYCGQCCGKSSPCLPFFYLWQRRSLWDGLTSFRRYFLCRSISFYSIE